MSLLEVEGLSVWMQAGRTRIPIVEDVSYAVDPAEIFGIAGESGSGKTLSVLALIQLLPRGMIATGRARLDGRDLLTLPRRAMRHVRGKEVAMVFQDPLTSLHPMLPIGRQMIEHVRIHENISRRAARTRAVELLTEVQIPDPQSALQSFPHQLSGGMRQRVAIASALATRPRLLIADEPTTALDVTVQAGILQLLDRLRRKHELAVMLITHDLGVLSAIADAVHVMYAGRIVESGRAGDLLLSPRHPYTRALLDALPHADDEQRRELRAIPGQPPQPFARPPGCAFHPRCPYERPECRTDRPELLAVDGRRRLACHVDPFRSLS
ncbi:MAG TPA: ABC transporter ATP-binding protein [Gaiellaceae bacterium]|nr:ABC transporter ATP-binding protein [Gaiellaceae bacterium]